MESAVVLQSSAAQVTVDLKGGPFTDFRLAGSKINVLDVDWAPVVTDLLGLKLTYPWRGHFLCFDCFTDPPPEEAKRGIPMHGEASQVDWQVLDRSAFEAEMACELPLAGMGVQRHLALAEQASVFTVRETFTNHGPARRMYNAVQHANIAAPFLDESVLLDCNATQGLPAFEGTGPTSLSTVDWPLVDYQGSRIDLRTQKDPADMVGLMFTIDPQADWGWVTACNLQAGLMLGYMWRRTDYPWMLVLRLQKEGRPTYLTFEMAASCPSAGLYEPLATDGKLLNHPLYEYLDAGKNVEKSYTTFLTPIPADYQGVESVQIEGGQMAIRERSSDQSRTIALAIQ